MYHDRPIFGLNLQARWRNSRTGSRLITNAHKNNLAAPFRPLPTPPVKPDSLQALRCESIADPLTTEPASNVRRP
jgi:hypothetical protein